MATHIQLSQILKNLILSSAGDMVNINKTTLVDIQVHIQHAHETIEFLQLESKLQRNKLREKRVASMSLTNPVTANHSTSFIHPASSVEVAPVQLSSKPIIKPWEEIQSNQNRRGLGYVEDDDNLHFPDYSKPIQFVSADYFNISPQQVLHKLQTDINAHKLKVQTNRNACKLKL